MLFTIFSSSFFIRPRLSSPQLMIPKLIRVKIKVVIKTTTTSSNVKIQVTIHRIQAYLSNTGLIVCVFVVKIAGQASTRV